MRADTVGLGAITVLSLTLLFLNLTCASEPVSLSTTSTGAINLKADNAPLNQLVKDLSRKFGLDLKGTPLSGERVRLELTDCSLEEALRWLLRGYNYVLIREDGPSKGSVLVLSRAERAVHNYPPASSIPAVSDAAAQAPTPSQRSMGGQESVTAPRQALARPTGTLYTLVTGSQGSRATFSTSSSPQASAAPAPAAGTGTIALAPPAPPQIAGIGMPPTVPAVTIEMGPVLPTSQSQPQTGPPTPPQVPDGPGPQQRNADNLTPPQVPF